MAEPLYAYFDDLAPEDVIEALGSLLAARYQEIELRMIEAVVAAVKRGDVVDLTDVDRAKLADQLRRFGQNLADQALPAGVAERILAVAAESGAVAAANQLGLVGIGITGATTLGTQTQGAIAALALDLTNRLDTMRNRITRWAPDVYRRIVSEEISPVLGGVEDIRVARNRVATRLLGAGVDGFTDAAGRNWRIGTYAEMATRTTSHRAYQAGSIGQQQQYGFNLVTIDVNPDGCSKCAETIGRIYSTDGTPAGTYELPHATEDRTISVVVHGSLESARVGGWDHPNCGCRVVTYLPGAGLWVIPRTWTPEREKARDDLRALERRMRELRRRKAAAMSPADRRRAAALVKAQDEKIRAHVAATEQVRRRHRESASFADGRTPKASLPALPPVPTL